MEEFLGNSVQVQGLFPPPSYSPLPGSGMRSQGPHASHGDPMTREKGLPVFQYANSVTGLEPEGAEQCATSVTGLEPGGPNSMLIQ